MSNINFDNPYLLLIAVPLIVLFTVPFVLAVRKDNRNAHNVASQVMHVVLAIIIAFAAAGTSITTVLTQTHVYVVADVSYSANKNLDTIDNIIKSQLVLPRNSKVGIVTFGKNYELLCDLTDQKNVESVKKSIESGRIDDSETNIAEALEYAGSLFGNEAINRIVLITDAKQTDDVDTSAMRRAVDYLESRDIKVDAYFLDDNLSSEKPEVQISGAEFTASAFINHKESVNVTVQTNCETKALMYLFKNGEEIHTEAADFTVGQNSVSMTLDTTESGMFDYEVRVQTIPAENDSSDYNNNYKFTQTVSNDLKVLIVTSEWEDVKTLIDRYADSAAIDVYENDAKVYLSEKAKLINQYADNDDINIYCFDNSVNPDNGEGVKVKNVPISIEDICTYDEIVLSNVDVRLVSSPTKFVQSLDIAVSTFGKSLVTLGNTYIQEAPQSSTLRSLSDILPVRFGQSDDEARLYTIIMDASRSMFMGSETSKIELAKAYTEKLLGTLNQGDQLCIIGFYGDAWMVYGPRSYSGSGEVIRKIDEITIKQGTVLSGGLQMAKDTMLPLVDMYGDKQIMIITDGKDSSSDYDKSRELVTDLIENDIVTSVIHIDRTSESGSGTSSARRFSQELANLGKGKFFFVDADVSRPPDDLTFGQMAGQIRETVVEKDTEVVVSRATDDVLANFPKQNSDIPDVSGYFVAATKASATNVLQVKHQKNENSTKDLPLYAYWGYGNGKVASFTSSFDWLDGWKNKGATDIDKNLDQAFLDNVLYVNIPKEKNDYPYMFSVTQDGSASKVLLTPHKETLHFDATAKVKVILPSGEVVDENLVFNANHYYYNFKSAEVGRYQVEVVYSYLGFDYKAVSVFNISYASEYDEFATFEASPLFRAINGRGQVVLEGKLLLENDEHEMGTYTNDFTIPLLIIAVALFVVDIIVRKLKWEDIVSFFGGFKKSQQAQSGGKKS